MRSCSTPLTSTSNILSLPGPPGSLHKAHNTSPWAAQGAHIMCLQHQQLVGMGSCNITKFGASHFCTRCLFTQPMVPSMISINFAKYNIFQHTWRSHVVFLGKSLSALQYFYFWEIWGNIFFLYTLHYCSWRLQSTNISPSATCNLGFTKHKAFHMTTCHLFHYIHDLRDHEREYSCQLGEDTCDITTRWYLKPWFWIL